MKLTPRTCDKTIKIARTIADIEKSDVIEEAHISEALQYRGLESIYGV